MYVCTCLCTINVFVILLYYQMVFLTVGLWTLSLSLSLNYWLLAGLLVGLVGLVGWTRALRLAAGRCGAVQSILLRAEWVPECLSAWLGGENERR